MSPETESPHPATKSARPPQAGGTLPVATTSGPPARWIGNRRSRIWLLGIAAAVLAVAAIGAWRAFWTPTPLGFASGNGRIEATEIDVATKLAGRVEAIFVAEGDSVVEGQVVARLDAQTLEAQLKEAEALRRQAAVTHRVAAASFDQQESLRRLAEKEFGRASRLFEQGVVSEDELDRRRVELETTTAAAERASRQLEEAARGIDVAAARVHRFALDVERSRP